MLLLVTGASGVGKSTVRRVIELQAAGRHVLLAGDPVPAAEVVAAPSSPLLEGIAVCLLDASPEAQSARLTARGDDPTGRRLVPRLDSRRDPTDRRAPVLRETGGP